MGGEFFVSCTWAALWCLSRVLAFSDSTYKFHLIIFCNWEGTDKIKDSKYYQTR